MKHTVLFSTMFGSRLYGTQTPTSDVDWKHIVLPDFEHLLLGRGVENKVKKTNNEKNTRNGVDDVDEEFIPIQVFAKHFIEGQTYALELAFALEGTHASQTVFDPRGETHYSNGWKSKVTFDEERAFWDYQDPMFITFVQELREQFLTSNIKAMMGYVVNQANLYSFKGERLNAAKEFYDCLMQGYEDPECGDEPLTDFVNRDPAKSLFEALQIKYPKYFKITEYDIGGGRMRPCFVLLEKYFPHTNTLSHSLAVVNSLIKKYGSRAEQASESNVDWKATMHALRIVDEGIELLRHKRLSFPFNQDYVDRLLQIKRGELPLDPIKDELSSKLELLKDLEKTTDLPECNQEFREKFDKWLGAWMRKFYRSTGEENV
jgi:hypothetical protein